MVGPGLSTTVVDDCLVVCLTGDLDLTARHLLHSARARVMRASEPHVVLDLGGVTFLDCSSAGTLAEMASFREPEIPMVCPAGPVLRLLEMTGYADEHLLVPTLDAALASHGVVRLLRPAGHRGARRLS
jgi:anti-anti-sigma factor